MNPGEARLREVARELEKVLPDLPAGAARTRITRTACLLLQDAADLLPTSLAVELCLPAGHEGGPWRWLVVDVAREVSQTVWAGDLPGFLAGLRGHVVRLVPTW